ncbi:MAG: chemotaxis protein CheW [Deltaproteobacteria bacterium]|nr:chemotaxis protein CheW [Deltaproteobacteria bacterium]
MDIVADYTAESRELLEQAEGDLLSLERMGENADPDIIHRLFRTIHSIKGGAAFLGFHNINELAHALESLLSQMRNHEISSTREVMDLLLEGTDRVRHMIHNIHDSNTENLGSLPKRILTLVGSEDTPAQTPAPTQAMTQPPVQSPAQSTQPITPPANQGASTLMQIAGLSVSREALTQVNSRHQNIYLLTYDLTHLPGGETPAGLTAKLSREGVILSGGLNLEGRRLEDGVPQGALPAQVLVASWLLPDFMEVLSRLPSENIQRVGQLEDLLNQPAQSVAQSPAPIVPPAVQPVAPPVAPPSAAPAGYIQGPDQTEAHIRADFSAEGGHIAAATSQENATPTAIDAATHMMAKAEASDTIRINITVIDKLMRLAAELVLLRNQFIRWADHTDPVSRHLSHGLDIVTSEIQEGVMATRMQPVGNLLGKFPRVVRDLSRSLGKEIEIEMLGREVEMDKALVDALNGPMTHLVRNACDHGLETPQERVRAGKPPVGRLLLHAFHEGGQINLVIKDDGRGIDTAAVRRRALERGLKTESDLNDMSEEEIHSLIFLPGFSTAQRVTDVSGRGVGMDVVRTTVNELGGHVEIHSVQGKGSTITLKLPLTLAIIPCLIVKSGEQRYAVPQVNVEELVAVGIDAKSQNIEFAGDREVYRLRNRLLPIVRLNDVLAQPETFSPETRRQIMERHRLEDGTTLGGHVVVMKFGTKRLGMMVDRIQGMEEIVVKPVHPALKHLPCYSGATVMGDGQVALILDVPGVAKHTGVSAHMDDLVDQAQAQSSQKDQRENVLLFANGPQEQFAMPLSLIKRVERIERKDIERVGEREFITIDGVSTQIIRLDQYLNVSPPVGEAEELFLILPKLIRRSLGVLATQVIDIEDASLKLNVDSHLEDGLMGSSILRGRMTLFLDIHRMADRSQASLQYYSGIQAPTNTAVAPGRKVLVVEDSAFFRNIVRDLLTQNGLEVETAGDGQDALRAMDKNRYDLIVSDLQMPVMNGFDLARNVRARKAEVPMIALSSLDSDRDIQAAKEAGFNHYHVKLDKKALLGLVKQVLEAAHPEDFSGAQASSAAAATAPQAWM